MYFGCVHVCACVCMCVCVCLNVYCVFMYLSVCLSICLCVCVALPDTCARPLCDMLGHASGFSPAKKSSMVSVYNTAGWGAGCTGIPSPSQIVLKAMVLVVTVILNAVVS